LLDCIFSGVNNSMTRENKEILNNLLNEWFGEINKIEISKHFWAENSTGKIIKDKLKKLSHWKNRSVGRKGNIIQLELARKKKLEILEAEKKKELDKKSKWDNLVVDFPG